MMARWVHAFLLPVTIMLTACRTGYFPGIDLEAKGWDWLEERLEAFGEPALGPQSPDTIRVAYFGSFQNPLCLRLTHVEEDAWDLVTKVTDGSGGGEAGILRIHATRRVGPTEVASPLKAATKLNLHGLPVYESGLGMYTQVLDGNLCVLEHVRDGDYRVIIRSARFTDLDFEEMRGFLESELDEWENPENAFIGPDGKTWVRTNFIEDGEDMGWSEGPLEFGFTRAEYESYLEDTLIPERRTGELITVLCDLSNVPDVQAWRGVNGLFEAARDTADRIWRPDPDVTP